MPDYVDCGNKLGPRVFYNVINRVKSKRPRTMFKISKPNSNIFRANSKILKDVFEDIYSKFGDESRVKWVKWVKGKL